MFVTCAWHSMIFQTKHFIMKKTACVILAITCTTLFSFAQESNFFIKGGVNMANVSITDNGKYDDANTLVSFHAGIMADLPISGWFSFQPGLLFTGKGSKTQSGQSTKC